MKILKLSLSLLILFLYFNGCQSDSPVEPNDSKIDYSEDLEKYFLTESESVFNFSMDTLNANENIFINIGSRSLQINSQEKYGDNNYYICENLYKINDLEFVKKSKFRYSDNSIILIADTTNITEQIPDSLKNQISFNIDDEITLLEFPLVQNKMWSAFKGKIDFEMFSFNVIDITGEYVESEQILLDGFSESFKADKIRYKTVINLPDLANPFISKIQIYYSDVWFVESKGIVKLEGNKLFLNPILGMNIEFCDSNKVIKQTLISLD